MASSASATHSNRLINERSPYLLQHAHNPVDWYPWGQEAIDKAKETNTPIFLSIGYSTCHWCHVMERESFESQDIAQSLNANFVCIKLDREERPDLDKIYMKYVMRVNMSGGWPLTVFLTPDLDPIYGGTYFPPDDKNGNVGFKTLVETIAKQWKTQHVTLKKEAKEAMNAVQAKVFDTINANTSDLPAKDSWKIFYAQLYTAYDRFNGGFMKGVKFPQPSFLNFLFYLYRVHAPSTESRKCLRMAVATLRKIGYRGIHDHVGNGFARYTVDNRWQIPHFEKMLYDQAQLAVSFVEAYQTSEDEFYKEMAEDALLYVGRDLSHAEGGFFAAEDADSYPTEDAPKKREGAFYVWRSAELLDILTNDEELEVFGYHFGVRQFGNVPLKYDLHNELDNRNVLCCFGSYEQTAAKFGKSVDEAKDIVSRCLEILRVARDKRPRPALDTKIVTAWNALMISAYAKAGFAFNNEEYLDRAIRAAEFIRTHLTTEDGALHRCCYGKTDEVQQSDTPIVGVLEDYAFFIRSLIHLYEATMDASWLAWAEQLQELQNKLFWDYERGSYFHSNANDPNTIIRDKDDQDTAEPCGNSVAAANLIRLDEYLQRKDYREMAEQIFKGFSPHIKKMPLMIPELMCAFLAYFNCASQVTIAGERNAPDTEALLAVLRKEYLPRHVIILADGPTGKSGLLYERNEHLNTIAPIQGKATAYVCKDRACSLPVTSPDELHALLTGKVEGKDEQKQPKKAEEKSSSSSSDSD